MTLKRNDVGIIICTGRHFSELEKSGLSHFPFDGYIVMSGQVCLDKSHHLIKGFPIIGDSRQALVNLFNNHKMPIIIAELDSVYINYQNPLVDIIVSNMYITKYPVGFCSDEPIYRATIFSRDNPLINQLGLRFNYWHVCAMDACSLYGGMVNSMKIFMEYYHIHQDNTIAFGDDQEDNVMLQYAGIGIATNSACPSTKDVADCIIKDSDIEATLISYGLLQ